MKVRKRTLLLIACFVWGIAGLNILKIGVEAYPAYLSVFHLFLSLLVFYVFQFFIFGRLVAKHTALLLAGILFGRNYYRFGSKSQIHTAL